MRNFIKTNELPHHCEIYKSSPKSYKDLPIRLAEFSTVYRYEQSGGLHGLTRVTALHKMTHIFCRPDQLKKEFIKVSDIVFYIFKTLNFNDFVAQVSLRQK